MNVDERVVFIFAHQDDEFGIFSLIEEAVRETSEVWCVYLTDGGEKHVQREKESRNVLSRLGVRPENIRFLGSAIGIADGSLIDNLTAGYKALADFLEGSRKQTRMYLPAWEGGHTDHDAAHALGVVYTARSEASISCWQYSLYHKHQCVKPFFRVMSPLFDNGAVAYHPLNWRQRVKFVLLCLKYPSQFKSWVGLLPFVACHYLLVGKQFTQPVAVLRLSQRPHEGQLYYEYRGSIDWNHVNNKTAALINGD